MNSEEIDMIRALFIMAYLMAFWAYAKEIVKRKRMHELMDEYDRRFE